jgi:hypothetical protein
MSRSDMLDGFIYSDEFKNIANNYGIEVGDSDNGIISENNPELTTIEAFVNRFYTEVLERPSDVSGLENWSSQLENGTKTADDIANGFFFSEEFINKNLDNDNFVDIAYQSLLGREADVAGKNSWINNLDNGMSRSDMLDGFIYSDEFKTLANNYGIEVGKIIEEVPNIPVNSWNHLVGHYLLEDLELTTSNGSSFYISGDELDNTYMDISLNGNLYSYISANGTSESVSAQITSVSSNTIYMYDSYYHETDDMNYLFDGETLTLYDSEDGNIATMDWLLQ